MLMFGPAKKSAFFAILALFYITVVMGLFMGTGQANAQQLLEMQPLGGTVYRVIYRGSLQGNFDNNMLVSVGKDGLFMVDHRNTLDNAILPFIENEFDKRVKIATNTHWHPDHTNGNRWFGSEVVIITHEKTRERRSAVLSPSWAPGGLPPLPRHALADITFRDELALYFEDEPIKFISLPVGHTDSDILILFSESEIAAVGDVYNGRGQLSGYDYYSGDPRNYLVELDALLDLIPNDFRLVTGHGGVDTRNDLVEYRALYAQLLDELDSRRREGMSAEAAAELGLPHHWLDWLPRNEYDDSGDWLLETTRRLWRDAEAEKSREDQ